MKLSGTKCWSMSLWCVSAPSETRLTDRIDAGVGVETEMFEPYVGAAGAVVIVGRGPVEEVRRRVELRGVLPGPVPSS